MSSVAWNALMQPIDYAGSVQRGFEWGTKMRQNAEDRAWQGQQRARQQEEWQRSDNLRNATADMMLGGGQTNALMGQPMQRQPMPQGATSIANPVDSTPVEPSAYERAVRADPEKFLTFQGKRLELNASDLKNYRTLNDTAMQLLGGVNDQATYDLAKKRAAALYSSYGHDASQFLSGLPPEYTPQLVESLQMQGMDTAKQMAAVARENRLEWDMEDDQLDNERADLNADSLIDYREERLEDYDAAEQGRNRRFRTPRPTTRGNPRGAGPKAPSPTSVVGRIMDKQASGQPLTPAEQKTYDEYRGGRGRSRGGGAAGGRSAIIVNPKTGQRMKLEGGKWVPIK